MINVRSETLTNVSEENCSFLRREIKVVDVNNQNIEVRDSNFQSYFEKSCHNLWMRAMSSAIPPEHQRIEIIPNRLLFSVERSLPPDTKKTHFFTVDEDPQFEYQAFYYDFGPLSLLCIHRFKCLVDELMETKTGILHFISSPNPPNLANNVLLIASYRMITLNLTADEAYEPLAKIGETLKPFRDASTVPSTYDLTVISCLKGLKKGMDLGWYIPDDFDPDDWEFYEQVENGDMNWLIPGKLLAFATAYDSPTIRGWKVATPQELVPIFKKKGITCVVRLCEKFYNEQVLVGAGFEHVEMYFTDGSTPPATIRDRFLALIEGPAVVALHCKAGLGRTGTLAGCHMIKNCGFTPHEAIAWIRICRPGSVIGPQQQYLIGYAQTLTRSARKVVPPPAPAPAPPAPESPQRKKPVAESPKATPTRRTTATARTSMRTPEKKTTKGVASTPTPKNPGEVPARVQKASLTPHCPQPRKYRMAAHQRATSQRSTPRKPT